MLLPSTEWKNKFHVTYCSFPGVCVYVSAYVCVCIVYICVYMYARLCDLFYVCVCLYMYSIYMYIHVCMFMWVVCVCICVYIVYICLYMYACYVSCGCRCICVRAHVHVENWVQLQMSFLGDYLPFLWQDLKLAWNLQNRLICKARESQEHIVFAFSELRL